MTMGAEFGEENRAIAERVGNQDDDEEREDGDEERTSTGGGPPLTETGQGPTAEAEREQERRRRRRERRDIFQPDEPTAVISPEGESIPLSDLPSAEERRERLEDERLDEEQLSERISRRRRLGLDETDLLDPDEERFTTRLDLDTGEPIETFAETRGEQRFRQGQEAALADQFGGGTQGEISAREERRRFDLARREWAEQAFSKALDFADVLDNAGVPESEQRQQMEAFLERDFDNFVGQRTEILTGDLPRDELQTFASRVLNEDRKRDEFEAIPKVRGGDGSFITQSEFDALTPQQQQIFTSQGREALRTFTNEFNQSLVTGAQPSGAFLPPPPTGFGVGEPIPVPLKPPPFAVDPQGLAVSPEQERAAILSMDFPQLEELFRAKFPERVNADGTIELPELPQLGGVPQGAVAIPSYESRLRETLTQSAIEGDALNFIPYYQVITDWNQLTPVERGVLIALDTGLLVEPLIGPAAKGTRNALGSVKFQKAYTQLQRYRLEVDAADLTLGSGPMPPKVRVITKERPETPPLAPEGVPLSPSRRAGESTIEFAERKADSDIARARFRQQNGREPTQSELDESIRRLRQQREQANLFTTEQPPTPPAQTGGTTAERLAQQTEAQQMRELAEQAARNRAAFARETIAVRDGDSVRFIRPTQAQREAHSRFRAREGRDPTRTELARETTQLDREVSSIKEANNLQTIRRDGRSLVDTETNRPITPEQRQRIIAARLTVDDFPPIEETKETQREQGGVVTSPDRSPIPATTVFEGETAGPVIFPRPSLPLPEDDDEQAPLILTPPAGEPGELIDDSDQTFDEPGGEPTATPTDSPLRLPSQLASPEIGEVPAPLGEVNPLTEQERETGTDDFDDTERLIDEAADIETPRDTPITPRGIEAARARDIEVQRQRRFLRPDIDLDLDEEMDELARPEQSPLVQGFRLDLQDDPESPEDDLYVVANRETGETQFSTEPVASIPTTGPDENQSLRTITTDDQEHPERIIQVGDRTYALNDQTLEQINELESEIGRPLTVQEREMMALSVSDDDAASAIERRVDNSDDESELSFASDGDSGMSDLDPINDSEIVAGDSQEQEGRGFNVGRFNINASGGNLNISTRDNEDAERVRESPFPVLDSFNKRRRKLDPNRRLARRFK